MATSFSWNSADRAIEAAIVSSESTLPLCSQAFGSPRCDWAPGLCKGIHSYSNGRSPGHPGRRSSDRQSESNSVNQSPPEIGVEVEQPSKTTMKPVSRKLVMKPSPLKPRIEIIILSDDESVEI